MSGKLRTLLEAVKKRRAETHLRPRPIPVNFVKQDKLTGDRVIVDRILVRQDGVFRLPPMDDPMPEPFDIEEDENDKDE